MASSVSLRQKSGSSPSRSISRTRSNMEVKSQGQTTPQSPVRRYRSQMSDVVVEASPSLTRSTSLLKKPISPSNRFSSAMAKTLNLEAVSQLRKRRPRTKAAKSNVKTTISAAFKMIKQAAKPVRKDGLTPLQRFKKAARLVKLLVTVSNVCREQGILLVYAIKDEQWYEFCEKFLKDASAGGTPIDKHSFVTTIKNPLTKQFEQLEFDAAQFKHDYHSGTSLLTPDIKAILNKRPGSRSAKEVEDCVYCIKRLVPSFRGYTFEQQKRICQHVMYDRYFQERVILRENLPPDGIYFVLNGTLMESGQKMPSPRFIKPGDKFGEEDLKSGMTRQSNVVTKSSVDLLYLHKFDYEEIFELSVDLSGDPTKVFDICKQELVFNYYPIGELVKNPGRWQVLKFKYGRLIATNSCETEFIYIIRSGEARVMKGLTTKTINVAQRRRRLQAELDSADPYVYKKNLLDFVSDNKFHSARYSLNTFSAKNLAADSTPIAERVHQISSNQREEKKNVERPKTAVSISLPKEGEEVNSPQMSQNRRIGRAQTASQLQQSKIDQSACLRRPHTTKPSSNSTNEDEDMYRSRKNAITKNVPRFVQVDSLHAGNTYGMRSLLPLDQRGEPAALVSAGCEVIQINRKFFSRYLDDNMINIIALKAKVYPTEEELLKRLDVNLQWEEYCAIVMCGYLDSKVVGFRGSHVVLPQ